MRSMRSWMRPSYSSPNTSNSTKSSKACKTKKPNAKQRSLLFDLIQNQNWKKNVFHFYFLHFFDYSMSKICKSIWKIWKNKVDICAWNTRKYCIKSSTSIGILGMHIRMWWPHQLNIHIFSTKAAIHRPPVWESHHAQIRRLLWVYYMWLKLKINSVKNEVIRWKSPSCCLSDGSNWRI